MATSHVMVSTACCFSNTIVLRRGFMECWSCHIYAIKNLCIKGGLKIGPYKQDISWLLGIIGILGQQLILE